MKNLYLGLKFSFSYFSILPISFRESDDLSSKEILGAMVLFLPSVGLLLGAVTISIYLLFLSDLGWYGATISSLIYMVLYGFIHTEAVLDVADAIYASHSGKDAYKIIKEPIVGAMGVLYAIGVVIAKIAGISYLLLNHLYLEFIIALITSRVSLIILFYIHQFRSSFATQLKESITTNSMIISIISYSAISLLMSYSTLLIMPLGILLAISISFWIKGKIGFVNGDVLGTTLEGVEIILFMIIAKLF